VITTATLIDALRAAGLLVETVGVLPTQVVSVEDDSRKVIPGAAFVAVRGAAQDGHAFLPQAQSRGAALVIAERTDLGVPALIVRESRRAVAIVGAAAAGHPSRSLVCVGVTGTSGKTTTVSMLRHLLDGGAHRAASIGTLGVLVGRDSTALPGGAGLTTPGPIELHRVLRELADVGVGRVAMEVSSHALDQHRVEGITFAAAVFTNLSRDHLDYHASMEDYFAAKARLAAQLAPGGAAVVNADVPEWTRLPHTARTIRYGVVGPDLEVAARDVSYHPEGSRWTLVCGRESAPVALSLVGDFNVLNALGAAAAAWAVGEPVPRVAEALATIPQIPGRLERISDRPIVLRDYAHKPDALSRALGALRPFTPRRLILVFGCGGDRDRGKRPLMAAIAERLSDLVIITSDNPRTENPESILNEIESGMTRRPFARIEDRRQAIAAALDVAREGDVVLLAGKGHETYQIRGTGASPFDEKQIVAELLGNAR
jgi:UDP-N-acetylmuramoyl-L-alanyl-D-glutamate--2,6-diaminopimelate ligase